MVPFIYSELKSLLRNLLQLDVNPDVLNKCKPGLQMALIDLDLKESILPLSCVELGFGVDYYHKSEKKRHC